MNYEAFLAKKPLLDAILAILPGAYIAGGYVRDLLLDKPPRDIDVLTDIEPTTEQFQAIDKLMGIILYEYIPDFGSHDEQYVKEGDRTSDILTLYKDDSGTLEIIVVNDAATHISEFPDCTSQVWYGPMLPDSASYVMEGSNWLSYKPSFLSDHTNKTITYRATAPRPRLEKLMVKFPDYTPILYGANYDFSHRPFLHLRKFFRSLRPMAIFAGLRGSRI